LKRSSVSVVLNIAEGSASRAGTRRQRYCDALGSARETLANLEAAHAVGYLAPIDPVLRNDFDQILGTLTKLVR